MSNSVTVELRAAGIRLQEHLKRIGLAEPSVIPRGDKLVVAGGNGWAGERMSLFEDIWSVQWEDAA
ncbi:MAG: hypothetical protein ACREF0_03335 [Acetobacteraceae bacterium]